MNHMAEVAKLLGVELGEEFKIKGCSKTYILDEDGLFDQQEGMNNFMHLTCLLTGEFEIMHKPWKPKDNDHYYRINECGNVECDEWLNFGEDIVWYKLGNCYRTKEEAKANREKWLAFYASDEVLEV